MVDRTVVNPKAKIPIVLFPAAAPFDEETLAAVATALTSPEYVYLLRVVEPAPHEEAEPNANMPIVLLPAADPYELAAEDAVAPAFVKLE